jgi:hypothetical protein
LVTAGLDSDYHQVIHALRRKLMALINLVYPLQALQNSADQTAP